MSKYIKSLLVKELASRLEGVHDALLVNVVGLDANKTMTLRRQLRQKQIQLLVVKNGLARQATRGTSLEAAFTGPEGTLAMVWGAQDFVTLAKEVVALDKGDKFKAFQARGGVMDGESLTPERIRQISKWPNREEQLSLLVGQILGPGANLAAQLIGPGGTLASQIEQKSEQQEESEEQEEAKQQEEAKEQETEGGASGAPQEA